MSAAPLTDILAHPRLTACVALRGEPFKEFVRRVALFARQALILLQERISTGLKGAKDRRRARFRQLVGARWLIGNRFLHGFAGVALFTRHLSDALVLEVVGPADPFAVFHANHLLLLLSLRDVGGCRLNDSRNAPQWLTFQLSNSWGFAN